MTKFYLALYDDSKYGNDKYKIIDLRAFGCNYPHTGRYDTITKITSKYNDYNEMINDLIERNLVQSDSIGLPFVIALSSYNGFTHRGKDSFPKQNKVFFKENAHLVEKPSKEELDSVFRYRDYYKYNISSFNEHSPFNAYIVSNLTRALLSQELNIPGVFSYETASQEEKDKYDFIVSFIEEVSKLINEERKEAGLDKMNVYKYNNLQPSMQALYRRLNLIDSFIAQLNRYISNAQKGNIKSQDFQEPIFNIVHYLCFTYSKNTYTPDTAMIYRLASIYTNYFDEQKSIVKKEDEPKQDYEEYIDDAGNHVISSNGIISYLNEDGSISMFPINREKKKRRN